MSTIPVAFPLTAANERALLEDNAVCRPDWPAKNARCRRRAVIASKAVVPIARRRGSGHGFLGMDPSNVDATAIDLFPDKYAQARAAGALDALPCYCVRPWTLSGLGLFGVQSTRTGGILVYTGGFAQSPVVARAVAAALTGERRPRRRLYRPERCTGFLRPAAPEGRRDD